jgi:hypothetical protein
MLTINATWTKQAEIYADTNFTTIRWFNDIKQEILAGTKIIFVVK